MSLPRVSVVIPARNAEQWIAETLPSVQAQTYPHELLEIILVDDGSTDATVAVAEDVLAQSDITHTFLYTPSCGPSAARNVGWRAARGEWIQFLDADDVVEPHKIATQAPFAANLPAQVAVVFSEWGRLIETPHGWTQQTPWVEPYVGKDALFDLIRPDNLVHTGAQLQRRTWLENVQGFREEYRLIEDVDILLRMVMQGGALRGVRVGQPLFWYRQRRDSLSRQDPRAFVEGCLRNARLVEAQWRAQNALTPTRAAFLSELYFDGARQLAEADPAAFERTVQWLYAVNPTFTPSEPTSLKWLTRVFGYRNAEKIAVRYRKTKARFKA